MGVAFAGPERGQVEVVERRGRLSGQDGRLPLEQAQPDRAGDVGHQGIDQGVERLPLRGPPPSLVDQVGVTRRQVVLERQAPPRQHELLELLYRRQQDRASGRLVDAARLDSDHPVLDNVRASHAMFRSQRVQRLEQREGRKRLPVDRHRDPLFEPHFEVQGAVGRVGGIACPQEHVVAGSVGGVLQRSALVADVPQVLVARVQLLLVDALERDPPRVGVRKRVFARRNVPLPPGSDHPQIRRQRGEGQLEAKLVVALAGAAVRQGLGTRPARDLDHAARDERSRDRRTEQVLAAVDRTCPQHREDVFGNEFLAQILTEKGRSPGCEGLAGQLGDAAPLADVRGHADHVGSVVLPQPRHDDRSVEATRVSQNDFHDWFSAGAGCRSNRGRTSPAKAVRVCCALRSGPTRDTPVPGRSLPAIRPGPAVTPFVQEEKNTGIMK